MQSTPPKVIRLQPQSTGKYFRRQLVASVFTLVAFNAGVYRLAAHSVPRQVLKHIDEMPKVEILGLGNSLMAAGLDEGAFASEWKPSPGNVAVCNAGLGATSPVEHMLLLRRALSRHPGLQIVVYGFFDFQLTAVPTGNWDDLFGNRAMCYYVDPDVAAAFYDDSWTSHAERRLIGAIPVFVERAQLQVKVERARRWAGEFGLSKEQTSRFGRAVDFSGLEPSSPTSFDDECDAVVRGNVGLSRPVTALLTTARQAGARTIVVEMPAAPQHIRTFYSTPAWFRYRDHVRNLVRAMGCEYLDMSRLVTGDDFADNLHLSPRGAEKFSKELARRLSAENKDAG